MTPPITKHAAILVLLLAAPLTLFAAERRDRQGDGPTTCTNPLLNRLFTLLHKGSEQDSGTSGLCDPKRYHGGAQFNSPQELAKAVGQSFLCSEPWIGQAYAEPSLGGGRPQGSGSFGECDPSLYGGASWSSYEDLKAKVAAYKMAKAGGPRPASPVPAPPPPPPPSAQEPPPQQQQPQYPNCSDASLTASLRALSKGGMADTGVGGLCSPNRYHDGQWSSAQQLDDLVKQSFLCDDPYIGQVFAGELNARPAGSGIAGECNPQTYGGGGWSSYAEAKEKILRARTAPPPPFVPGPVSVPSELTQMVTGLKSDYAALDGLEDALGAGRSPLDPEQSALQLSMLAGYHSLLEDLSNPAGLAMQLQTADATTRDMDPVELAALMERLIAESNVLHRNPDLDANARQFASLGGVPNVFFSMGVIDVESGLPAPNYSVRTDWSQFHGIELVVQQMRLARRARTAADVTGKAKMVADTIEENINNTNADLVPIPQLIIVLKAEAFIGGLIGVADSMANSVVAAMPNRIEAFYTTINGKKRNSGDAPVQIAVKGRAPVAAFMVAGSAGGKVMTPWGAASYIGGRVLKLEKVKKLLEKIPEQQRKQVEEFLESGLYKRLQQQVQQALGKSKAPIAEQARAWYSAAEDLFTIKPFRTPPVEIDSDAVLMLDSRSSRLLGIDESDSGPHSHKYFLVGLHNGEQAGYHMGLKRDLHAELQPDSVSLNRLGVVNVGDTADAPTNNKNWGKPCNPKTGAIGNQYQGEGVWMPAPNNKWISDGKGGAIPDPNGPWICSAGPS